MYFAHVFQTFITNSVHFDHTPSFGLYLPMFHSNTAIWSLESFSNNVTHWKVETMGTTN